MNDNPKHIEVADLVLQLGAEELKRVAEMIERIRHEKDSTEQVIYHLAVLLDFCISGERHETQNPYTIPVIKNALKFLAEYEGLKDYLNVDCQKIIKRLEMTRSTE